MSWLKRLKITSFALHVWIKNLSDFPWPSTWQLDFTSVAGTADNSVLYTSSDVSEYNYHIIENESGIACDVYASSDGTNYSTAAISVLLADDVTTGGGVKVITIPDNKVGILRGKFKKIKILQDGAGTSTAGTVRGFHGVD